MTTFALDGGVDDDRDLDLAPGPVTTKTKGVSATPQGAGDEAASASGRREALTPEAAIRAATVRLNLFERLWLRSCLKLGAWHAKRTGVEKWTRGECRAFLFFFIALLPITLPAGLLYLAYLLSTAKSYPNGYEAFFNLNAFSFGEKIMGWMPSRPRRQLQKFLRGRGEPFLLIPGAFSSRSPRMRLARALKPDRRNPGRKVVGGKATALLERGRYNLVASAVIAATGTEMRGKLTQDVVFRDFITDNAAEITQFSDGTDMHLRYRTATPEMPPAPKGDNTAARVIVFVCVENTIDDPICVIRADDVVDGLSADGKTALAARAFNIFDKWNTPQVSMSPGPNPNTRILHDEPNGSVWLTFDPNRVCPVTNDAVHNAAIGELMASIRKVAATKELKIVLHPGDVLVVDNYRALTRRQEHGHDYFTSRPLAWIEGRPLLRWLRVYYGFPPRPRKIRELGREGPARG